jgi:hypothetical protein
LDWKVVFDADAEFVAAVINFIAADIDIGAIEVTVGACEGKVGPDAVFRAATQLPGESESII